MKDVLNYVTKRSLKGMIPDLSARSPLGYIELPGRGVMVQLNPEETFNYVGVFEVNPAYGTRGRHKHLKKLEYVYVITGSARLRVWLEKKEEAVELELNQGDLVTVRPGVYHEYEALTRAWMVELSPVPFEKEDTIPYKATK